MRRKPGHALVQPDQQSPALAKRSGVAGAVRHTIAGGRWLTHVDRLTAWIHNVNPRDPELCINAVVGQKDDEQQILLMSCQQ